MSHAVSGSSPQSPAPRRISRFARILIRQKKTATEGGLLETNLCFVLLLNLTFLCLNLFEIRGHFEQACIDGGVGNGGDFRHHIHERSARLS